MATKIMLVEDDTNLSEIYQARLEAEGFEIVSAKDGEEALALAVNEHPDLIICDVMMPRISGFDMLDILRGTAGIQDTKVIMMTALSQAEDKARAEKLGANRYLVKSQVTLEDVVKTVHEVLGDTPEDSTPTPAEASAKTTEPTTTEEELPEVASTPTEPVVVPDPAPEPVTADPADIMNDQTTTAEQTAVDSQIESFVEEADKKDQTDNTQEEAVVETPTPMDDSGHSMNKDIEPEVHPTQTDIKDLAQGEDSKTAATGDRIDDIIPKPNQSTVSTVKPADDAKPELDPNQIAL